MNNEPAQLIGSTLGRYRILAELGSGGMGQVYLAEDGQLGRKVALKVLKSKVAQDKDRMRRFMQEAKTASALNHPNIITIYEIGSSDEIHYIATEFIEGETLHEVLRRGPLTVSQAVDVGVQLTRALQAAHAAGIIHRDIKPENVMSRPDGLVKILDFGIAKLSEAAAEDKIDAEAATVIEAYTHPGVVVGTVNYMSPEQARGLPVDARSDIFSLGILIYELVTGRQPFSGETVNHTFVAIMEDQPPAMKLFVQDYPAELEVIIMRCLEKDPARRFQSSADINDAFVRLQKRLARDLAETERSPDSTRAETQLRTKTSEAAGAVTKPSRPNEASNAGNLTQEITPLIGRQTETRDVLALLRSDAAPVVTLTGIGGTGKTRLARAVARAALPAFPDGVFFIDLSPISNAELVIASIAGALGVEEARGRPIIDVVADHLKDNRALLVIDNFEQVMPAAPYLSKLAAAAPGLRMLVTSREVLNLSCEAEYPVHPLATPAASRATMADKGNAGSMAERIRGIESVQLFVERAAHAIPGFELNAKNAEAVAKICSELEGLPLAIELAAARIKVLSPAAIVDKLESRLLLLTRGPRDLPDRQRTMRGAVEWSYDLLDESEKRVFSRLSVFNGGFTLDAAEAVCAGALSADNDEELVDVVTSLMEKSLLTPKSTAGDERRFRMLEVVREFAAEMLESAGDSSDAEAAHANYFVTLAERAEPHIQAAQSAEWLDRLELEHANLRSAMKWALAHDPPIAARLATSTRNFWLLHSHLAEGFRWLKAASAIPQDAVPLASRLKLLNAFALVARFLGDHAEARKAYQQALQAGQLAGDKRGIAVANRGLGLLALHDMEFDTARTYFESGLAASRELGDEFGIAVSLNFLGDVARTVDDNAKAKEYFEESLSILRKLDNKVALSDNLNNLAAAAFAVGDHEAAKQYFREALTIAAELGNKITISVSLDGFAAVLLDAGDAASAARLANTASAVRNSIGYEIEPAEKRFRDRYLSRLDESVAADGRELDIDAAIDLALRSS
jgi:non-specific serine/threonine protein kinase